MGNCLVIQSRKEIKVMSIDGEIFTALPAPPPSKALVHGFSGSDADARPAQKQHQEDPAGDVGQLYRLFPDAVKAPPPAAAAAAYPGAVVRVKLVISKQELRRMLGKDQAVSLDDMASLMRRGSEEQEESCRGWRPALHSIPEGSSDFY